MVKNLLVGGPARDWAFLVRINPLGSALTLGDLAAIVRPGLDGILIPKVNGIQDVELISNYVDVLEVAAGVTPGHVKLLVVATETPAAMIGLASYAAPSRRLIAMTWGAEDLGAALGALSNKEADGSWTFPYQVAWEPWRWIRCMRISKTRRGWRRAAGSRAATALSDGSPFTPPRSRRSMNASRHPKPTLRMRAAWWQRSRPNPMRGRSGSTARCTT